MTVCAIKGCHNQTVKQKKDRKIGFHVFPSDPIIASRWTEKIRLNRKESHWMPTTSTRICSEHFDEKEKYLTKSGMQRLRLGAIPTKGLHISCAEENLNREDCCKENSNDSHNVLSSQLETQEKNIDDELDSMFDTPRKATPKKTLHKIKLPQQIKSRKIKTVAKKSQFKKNVSLPQILRYLQIKRYIDNDLRNILSDNVFAAELYNKLLKKSINNKKLPMPKFTPEFRKFCLTLQIYSPRAYNYVRKTFNMYLPHTKTVHDWYKNINGSPGLTDEAFNLLKSKVQCTEKKLICALVADEMAIRPQNIKGGHGQVDLGTGTSGWTTKASEAYTLMLVCLNENWKIQIGYFLVNGLTGLQKSNIINICLSKCEKVGVKVVALTFDEHITNISAMEILGCEIKDLKKIKSTFKHPTADHEVAVFLDSNHMIKLVRNHFEDKKQFLHQHESKVDWEYLTKLNNLQEKENLRNGNKLTHKHIQFKNSIMKVKLTSKIFSRSVAVALKFCREILKLDNFKDSEGTEKFITIFYNLFDVFNTRRLTQHGFCHPLSNSNKTEIFYFLEEAKKYILNLNIKNTRKRKFNKNESSVELMKRFESVLNVKSFPGFKGLLICIESLMYLYKTLIEGTKELQHISTYRLSQDHIELFFTTIRIHSGNNGNPNALQFKSGYRKLLCRMELQVGETGNCVPLENISILTCSAALTCINSTTVAERFDDGDEELTDLPSKDEYEIAGLDITSNDEPNYKKYIVGYFASNVVRYVATRVKCQFCVDNMLANKEKWFHKLVCLRDNGDLVFTSKEVHSICNVAENSLRNYIKQNPKHCHTEKKLTLIVMAKLIGSSLFSAKEEHINGHYHDINLTRLIIERYLRIRLLYESKKGNSKTVSSKRQLF